jgi:carnitine 3-dehydrogenase
MGAGETLARWEHGLLASNGDGDGALPVREIPPEWIDYNGHVHESRYLQLFADATDALLRAIGVDAAYVAAGGSYYTVETHLSHLGQLMAGDRVQVITQVLGADQKRLHLFHSAVREGDPDPVATAEHMLLHVDTRSARSAPAADAVLRRVEALARDHSALERPARAGRRISLPE